MSKNNIIGSKAIKNSLKNVLEGNGPVTLMSVKKQSNDKKVFEDAPSLSAGKKMSFKKSGYWIFSENEVDNSCK